ncbi:MAG: universal stress protein, partial [Planctomycetota bacterium]
MSVKRAEIEIMLTAHRNEIRRILVGVDESNAAEHAIRAARELAGLLSAELEFVHAVPMEMPNWAVSGVPRWSAIRDEILEKASASRMDFLLAMDGGLMGSAEDIELTVMPGKPARVLLEREEQRAADLIVLGGHR